MSEPGSDPDPTVYFAALFDASGVLMRLLNGPRDFMDLNVSMVAPGGCWRPVTEYVDDADAPGGKRRTGFADVPPVAELAPAPSWPPQEEP